MTDNGLRELLDLQQSDGGWAYSTNSSWTEPTCYAVMALRWAGASDYVIGRATEWLARRQRRDGGWSPGTAVEQSTHVTSLAVMALSGLSGYEDIADRGVHCILSQGGAENSVWARMVRRSPHGGWPWIPGAAAWVTPTSLAILALLKQKRGRYSAEIEARVKDARGFLLSRRCPDQGWNHGGLFRPDERPCSYPETTGIALLALAGAGAEIDASIRRAEQHALQPRSSEGEYWLRLGLAALGRNPAPPSGKYRDWTVNQMALGIIADKRPDNGITGGSPFLDA